MWMFSDNDPIITPISNVERESLGYEILEDHTIECADCRRQLVNIIKVKEDDDIIKVISAQCPCGGKSFLYRVVGHTYMQAAKGSIINNMPMDIVDNIMHITIEVINEP